MPITKFQTTTTSTFTPTSTYSTQSFTNEYVSEESTISSNGTSSSTFESSTSLTPTVEATTEPIDQGLGTWAWVGIGVGCTAVFVVIAILIVCCVIRRRKSSTSKSAIGGRRPTVPSIDELNEVERRTSANLYEQGENRHSDEGQATFVVPNGPGRQRKISIPLKPITYNTDEPIQDSLDCMVQPAISERPELENYDYPKAHEVEGDDDDDTYKIVPSHNQYPTETYHNVSRGHAAPPPLHANVISDPDRVSYANMPPKPVAHTQPKNKPRYVNVDDNNDSTTQNSYLKEFYPPNLNDNRENNRHDYVNKEVFLHPSQKKALYSQDTLSDPEDQHDYENQSQFPKPPPPRQHSHRLAQDAAPNAHLEFPGERRS